MAENSSSPRVWPLLSWIFVAVALGTEVFLITTARIPTNSDQAVVGLMARHILAGQGHPVFFYGSTYAGTLEAHLCALTFAVFGSSMATYRFTMAALLILTIVGIHQLTRRWFGAASGLWTLAILSVGPFFFYYKGLTSDGHYNGLSLLTLCLLFFSFLVDEQRAQRKPSAGAVLGLGLTIGAGVWISPVSVPLSGATLLWLATRPARRQEGGLLILFIAGILAGSFPWWFWNLRHGWESVTTSDAAHVGLTQISHRIAVVVSHSIPILAGGAAVNRESAATYPGAAVLICLTWFLLLVPVALERWKSDRRFWLLMLAAGCLIVLAALSTRFVPNEPRFLIPLYALIFPLLGSGLDWWWRRRKRRVVACALVAVLVGTEAASSIEAPRHLRNTDGQVTASISDLLRSLEKNGIRFAYANYWTAYRVSFESNERVIATPIAADDLVRYVPYREAVDRDPSPAVVLLDRRDSCFEDFLKESAMGYRRVQVDEFGVFLDLDERALRPLREGFGIPLPLAGHQVGWQAGRVPASMSPGSSTESRVVISNLSPCPWPPSVHVGVRWWPSIAGSSPIYSGPRTLFPKPLKPGESEVLPVTLVAPAQPGTYRIEYDLVQENIAWFSDKGGRTCSVQTQVSR